MKNDILLGKLLLDAFKVLRTVEKDIENTFLKMNFSEELQFSFKNLNYKESFKRNFFTLLIISLLLESKLIKNNILSYTKIIFYLRQIVTSTDNIIDNESKGLIFLKNLKNNIVSNSLIMLTCQNELTKECLKLSNGKEEILNEIFNKIYSIALSESLRDKQQYKEYPRDEYILDKIHSGIGGELLKISLEIPLRIERNSRLEEYSKGLYEIGMALQALDDFFDVEEDEESGKVNLLKSKLIYENGDENIIKERYLEEVSKRAYEGLEIMEKNKFPMNKKEAKRILRKLFELRGLKEYTYILN